MTYFGSLFEMSLSCHHLQDASSGYEGSEVMLWQHAPLQSPTPPSSSGFRSFLMCLLWVVLKFSLVLGLFLINLIIIGLEIVLFLLWMCHIFNCLS